MADGCEYPLATPFFCTTHGCGVDGEGAMKPCRKDGCPHCGKGKKKSATPNVALLSKRLDDAVRARDRWLPRLSRAAREVERAVAEIRRLRSKLEAAGVYTDEDVRDPTFVPREG